MGRIIQFTNINNIGKHTTKPSQMPKTEPNCWKRYYAEIPGSVIKEQIPSKPRGRVLRNWLGKGNTNIQIKKEEENLKERDPKRPRLRESKEVDEVVVEDNEVVKVEESGAPIYSEKLIKIEGSGKSKDLGKRIAGLDHMVTQRNQEIKELKTVNKSHENQIYALKEELKQRDPSTAHVK